VIGSLVLIVFGGLDFPTEARRGFIEAEGVIKVFALERDRFDRGVGAQGEQQKSEGDAAKILHGGHVQCVTI
jgi:hypothetical protein